jgi:DNA repair protein SbcC/Rad50
MIGMLEKLHLVNIKGHKDLTVDFKNESTMILGSNGSGKSTIVESIFYLFFRSLLVKNINELINEDIIETNEETGSIKYLDKAFVEGWFNKNDKKYHLISGIAKTNSSLEVWDDESQLWVEKLNKINDIYLFIQEEIFLGMSAEYFINTIYTQQMGILNLVGKTEGVRQKEFDKLINIENFQIIYDAIGKPYSEFNKMVRTDVIELEDSVKEKESRLIEFKEDLNGFNKEHDELLIQEEKIMLLVKNSQTDLNLLESDFTRYRDAFNSAFDLGNMIKTTDSMLKDKSQSLEKLNQESNIKSIHEESTKLQSKLSIDYKNITLEASKIGNTHERKVNELELMLERLTQDSKTHDMINFYIESLKETDSKIPICDEEIKVSNENISTLMSEKEKIIKEIDDLKKDVSNITQDLTAKNVDLKSILKSYNNKNFNYKDIERYFNGEIEEYNHINSDCVCLYCSSKISKETMQSKIESDKKRYDELSNAVVDFENNLLSKQEELTLLSEQCDEKSNLISKFKTKLDYNLMLKNELSNKINELKVNLDSFRSKLIFPNLEASEIVKKITNTKDELFKIKNNPWLQRIRPYQNVEINDFSNSDIESLIPSIEDYESNNEYYSKLLSLINDYNQKFTLMKNDYDNLLKSRETHVENLSKIYNEFNVQSIDELKVIVTQKEDKIHKLKADFSSVEKDKIHILEQKKNISNFIDVKKRDIKYLEDDIKKIEGILETNKKIQKKLEILNVAKSYFKQDGLAKYIRSFYINKINENMASYIHIFGFDFLPRIDETAGIEKYYKYSGGQKIAIAILMKIVLNFILKNPIKMMILDEPTPYMDQERIEAIKDIVIKIKDIMQVFVITHDTEFMSIDCNKVLM